MQTIDKTKVDEIIDRLLGNNDLTASPEVWYGLHQIKKLPVMEIVRCGECELKIVCCRTIRSEGRNDDDFCSCGIGKKGEPMAESFRYVHHNKCAGGYAIEEVDHNTYCLGRADSYYEDIVLVPECKKCPRLIYNNEGKIDEYINRRKGELMEHKQPYCFKCRMFYKDKGKRFPTAHCAFETYVRCTGRLRGEKPERRTE